MGSVEFENFIYAFPAMEGCAKVSEKKRLEYLEMILRGDAPSREEQEVIFPDMARRMREKIGDNYWTSGGIRRYWWIEHNKIIENREMGYEDATDEESEVCKVRFWKVFGIYNGGRTALLKNKLGEKINAINYRSLKLEEIDYVVTHKKNIVDSVSCDEYEEHG